MPHFRCLLLILFLLLTLPACTVAPTAEFHAYRNAFTEARQAGEMVILDWAAAASREQAMNPTRPGPAPAAAAQQWPPAWSWREVSSPLPAVDDYEARILAWRVVEEYNTVLLDLLEGRSADQLHASIEALAESLEDFPWAAMGDAAARLAAGAAGPAGPVFDAARSIATEMQREADRRRFIQAVNLGAPRIRHLIALLKADADDYWRLRTSQLRPERTAASAQITALLRRVHAICATAGDPRHLPADLAARQAAEELHKLDGRLRLIRRDGFPPGDRRPPDGAYDPDAAEQIHQLVRQVNEQVNLTLAVEHEMKTYRDVLTGYVKLLMLTETSLDALAGAAEGARRRLPSAGEFEAAATQIRRTFAQYQKAR